MAPRRGARRPAVVAARRFLAARRTPDSMRRRVGAPRAGTPAPRRDAEPGGSDATSASRTSACGTSVRARSTRSNADDADRRRLRAGTAPTGEARAGDGARGSCRPTVPRGAANPRFYAPPGGRSPDGNSRAPEGCGAGRQRRGLRLAVIGQRQVGPRSEPRKRRRRRRPAPSSGRDGADRGGTGRGSRPRPLPPDGSSRRGEPSIPGAAGWALPGPELPRPADAEPTGSDADSASRSSANGRSGRARSTPKRRRRRRPAPSSGRDGADRGGTGRGSRPRLLPPDGSSRRGEPSIPGAAGWALPGPELPRPADAEPTGSDADSASRSSANGRSGRARSTPKRRRRRRPAPSSGRDGADRGRRRRGWRRQGMAPVGDGGDGAGRGWRRQRMAPAGVGRRRPRTFAGRRQGAPQWRPGGSRRGGSADGPSPAAARRGRGSPATVSSGTAKEGPAPARRSRSRGLPFGAGPGAAQARRSIPLPSGPAVPVRPRRAGREGAAARCRPKEPRGDADRRGGRARTGIARRKSRTRPVAPAPGGPPLLPVEPTGLDRWRYPRSHILPAARRCRLPPPFPPAPGWCSSAAATPRSRCYGR